MLNIVTTKIKLNLKPGFFPLRELLLIRVACYQTEFILNARWCLSSVTRGLSYSGGIAGLRAAVLAGTQAGIRRAVRTFLSAFSLFAAARKK